MGKLIDLLGTRLVHRDKGEPVGNKRTKGKYAGRLATTCEWSSELVVDILRTDPLNITAEVREEQSESASMYGPLQAAHYYVVFEDEQGVEHAMVHGDDVTDYRRTIDGYTIAGAFVFASPETVESYWAQSADAASKATDEEMSRLAEPVASSVELEKAKAWAEAYNVTVEFPILTAPEARDKHKLERGDYVMQQIPASEALKHVPDKLLLELFQADPELASLKAFFEQSKPRTLSTTLKALVGWSLEQRQVFAEKLDIELVDLLTTDKTRAAKVISRIVVRHFAESVGENACDEVTHPTIHDSLELE